MFCVLISDYSENNLFSCFYCRQTDLEALGSALQQYRDGHSTLIKWIEETTERQENTQPGQTDSKALSEQLAQQTVSNTDFMDFDL